MEGKPQKGKDSKGEKSHSRMRRCMKNKSSASHFGILTTQAYSTHILKYSNSYACTNLCLVGNGVEK